MGLAAVITILGQPNLPGNTSAHAQFEVRPRQIQTSVLPPRPLAEYQVKDRTTSFLVKMINSLAFYLLEYFLHLITPSYIHQMAVNLSYVQMFQVFAVFYHSQKTTFHRVIKPWRMPCLK